MGKRLRPDTAARLLLNAVVADRCGRIQSERDLLPRDLPLTDPLPVRVNGSAGEPGQNERSEACFSTET